MKPISPQAKEMLQAYRREEGLPPGLRAAVLRNVLLAHGTARFELRVPEPSASTSEAPATSVGKLKSGRLLRWLGPTGAVALGLAGWLYVQPPQRVQQAVAARAPSAVAELASPPGRPVPQALEPQALEAQARIPSGAPGETRAPARSAQLRVAKRKQGAARHAANTQLEVALPKQEAREPEPTPDAPAAEQRTSGSSSSLTSYASSSAGPANAAQTSPSTASGLDEEVMQMRTAYDYLRAGEPLRALSALAEHARRFPSGKLLPMRAAARVQALCALGRLQEASQEAERFLIDHADSSYAPRVRRVCAGVSAPSHEKE